MTNSEKLDLVLQELKYLRGVINRTEKKVNLMAEALLAPREVQQIKNIV